MQDFKLLPHTADLKVRVYGTTLQELFVHALVGMFHVIEPNAETCAIVNNHLVCTTFSSQRVIEVESSSAETLLVDFLSQALCFSDMYNEIYLNVDIKQFEQWKLSAIMYGVEIKGFGIEIKAVTYHDLALQRLNNLWQVDIVFDI